MPSRILKVLSLEPKYGKNYEKGYIGFSFYSNNLSSEGIAFFTKDARTGPIKVSHSLIVSAENECIESHTDGNAVRRHSLSTYFDDPRRQIFFRKPVGLTPKIAESIVNIAASQIGYSYDPLAGLAVAITNSFMGKVLNERFRGNFDDMVASLLNLDNKWMCSELVAYCLDQQPEYKGKGILMSPPGVISPQQLFEDNVIFETWRDSLD